MYRTGPPRWNRGYLTTLDPQGGPVMSDPIPWLTPAQFHDLFRSLVLDPELVLGRACSFEHLAAAVAREVGKTADRIFTPLVPLTVFLAQVLSDDHSCRGALTKLL